MEKDKNIIIGMGEILWDILPSGKVLGGAPANFAYNACQLGMNGFAVSAIGKDLQGNEIIETLKEKQLNYILPRVNFPTGTVKVTLGDGGIPGYEICEDVAWDSIPVTTETEQIARQTRAICFGTLAQRSPISRATLRHYLALAPDNSFRIFDINLRQHFYDSETIRESLKECNILKINDEELITISHMFHYENQDMEETCKTILKEYNLDIVILTKGINGSHVITPREISFRETPKVQVADTVGAGDSFTAAFTASLIKGGNIFEAHALAVEISAYVCTQKGAMPELPARLTGKLK